MLHIHHAPNAFRPAAMFDAQARQVRCHHCPVRGTGVCAAQGDQDLSGLAEMSRRVVIDPKSVLFEESEVAEAVYTVVSGALLLSRLLADGRRQVVGLALPGDFLGLALADKNAFTATALTSATLCKIDRERFSDLLDENPRLLRRLFSTSTNELSLAQDHMMLLGRRCAEEKVAAFIMNVRDRWSRIRGLSARVDLPMTRQDMGDYLGLTLETVSRTITKLAKEKMIAIIPDGVRILDIDKLKSAACM